MPTRNNFSTSKSNDLTIVSFTDENNKAVEIKELENNQLQLTYDGKTIVFKKNELANMIQFIGKYVTFGIL